MQEVVLGVGHQTSARGLVAVLDKELTRTQGIPRKITAQADNAEISAERPKFQGDFETFQIRVRLPQRKLTELRDTVATLNGACTLTEEGGWQVILAPPVGQASTAESQEAVDKVTPHLNLPEIWRVRGDEFRIDPVSIELIFQAMVKYKASDVHLSPGEVPVFRVDNKNRASEMTGPLSAVQIMSLVRQLSTHEHWDEFERYKQTSFSFHQAGLGYARVSAFLKSGAPHCTLRYLPENVPSFDDLHVPGETMVKLANLHFGLVLITGMTGSGKTTTAAALVDWINSNKTLHILTIENPVEYVHINKKSIISQRSLGTDVETFNEAVTGALRHDPDVLVIGEMRDPDTIRAAINAAATGHLVISTLHSNTACEVVNRVVSFFDPVERDLVKLQLRDCMRCVICQRLAPKIGGGRLPALEMMFNDIKPINDAIIEGDTDGIRVGMQQTVSHSFLFEEYLYRLYKQELISLETAQEFSTDQSILDQMIMGTYSVPRLDSLKQAREGGAKH